VTLTPPAGLFEELPDEDAPAPADDSGTVEDPGTVEETAAGS